MHEGVGLAVFIGGNHQPAVVFAVAAALAGGEVEIAAAPQRQHVVDIFARLAGLVAQAEGDGGADVAQGIGLLHAARLVKAVAQIGRLRGSVIGLLFVFHVQRAQFGEFERVLLSLILAQVQREGAERGGFEFGAGGGGCAQVPGAEGKAGAAVAEAGLIERDAVQGEGMVHFHGGGVDLAALPVGYDQIAGKVFRHAVFVVIHMELFEGYVKR